MTNQNYKRLKDLEMEYQILNEEPGDLDSTEILKSLEPKINKFFKNWTYIVKADNTRTSLS